MIGPHLEHRNQGADEKFSTEDQEIRRSGDQEKCLFKKNPSDLLSSCYENRL
jgi:hypothetical protein